MPSPTLMMLTLLAVTPATAPAYPSCDRAAQHALVAPTGGSIKDPRLAHVAMRVNIVQADIGSARKARRLTQSQADVLWRRAAQVRRDADAYTKKQGFLSAAERASYDRELDAISLKICQ